MTQSFVQFDKHGPFYDMVGAFLVGLSSCWAIFSAANPMKLEKSQYISITGVHVESKHLIPFAVFEQAQAGHITMAQFVGRSCMMLANMAYESVKDRATDHLNSSSFAMCGTQAHIRTFLRSAHVNRPTQHDGEALSWITPREAIAIRYKALSALVRCWAPPI